jgi:hypothetical protein
LENQGIWWGFPSLASGQFDDCSGDPTLSLTVFLQSKFVKIPTKIMGKVLLLTLHYGAFLTNPQLKKTYAIAVSSGWLVI